MPPRSVGVLRMDFRLDFGFPDCSRSNRFFLKIPSFKKYTKWFRNADIHRKRLFFKQHFNKFWFLSKVRAIWHHTETRVLSLGRPEFRRKLILESKKMLAFLANCRRYVDSACSFEKLTISSKNLPVEGTEGAYCGIQISARNSFLKQRIVDENDKIILEIWNGNLWAKLMSKKRRTNANLNSLQDLSYKFAREAHCHW